jgi:uncharacterized protein (TIGR01777 family)
MHSKVLITGGSGLVGSRLSERLVEQGNEVVHLSRFKNLASTFKTYSWDVNQGYIEEGAFKDVTHIIHLAGAGIAEKRWSAKRKQILTSSRVDSAKLIYNHLSSHDYKVAAFISASAIGIYGFDTGGVLQTEDRIQLGDDFLATLTKKWELAADQFDELGIRVIKLRFGHVLTQSGGLMGKLLPLAQLGLSSPFGNGEQYMSWIHIEDLVEIILTAIKHQDIKGVYNAVAPNPVTNKDFLKELSTVLNKPYFLPPTPKFVLKMILGELSSAITGGNKVSSAKIEQAGFKFQFTKLNEALSNLLRK